MTRVNKAVPHAASSSAAIRVGSSTLSISWGSATHSGNVRQLNEDAILAAAPVFVVADGMGGHDGGDIASALAVGSMSPLLTDPSIDERIIIATIAHANAVIHEQSGGGERGMGTTITGVVVAGAGRGATVSVVNVGDSRTYRLRGTRLEQITTDHSHVQELIDAGLIEPDEAADHPRRNVVTRALGIDLTVEVDVVVTPVAVGDRFLICSDGLSSELDSGEIAACLSGGDAQSAASALVAATLAGSARDNVTVIVLDIDGVEFIDDACTDPRRAVPAASGAHSDDITDRRANDHKARRSHPLVETDPPGLISVVPTLAPAAQLDVRHEQTLIDDVRSALAVTDPGREDVSGPVESEVDRD